MRTALVILLVIIPTLGYMLPWGVALIRRSERTVSIGWLNLLTAWTAVMWVALLVWAFLSDARRE